MTFEQLDLIAPILKAIQDKGYTTPTPIQSQAITPILAGRDILGCAQTGTGKTAAFAIPILQTLYKQKQAGHRSEKIKALIITPTRELAIQIGESFTAYGQGLGFRNTVLFGGVTQHGQTRKLRHGVDILIATPGRLLDLMNQGFVDLQGLTTFTLDEADRMLDMGFIHDIKKIIKKLPPKRQSLFFSATMPPSIVKLSQSLLTDPVRIDIAPQSTTAETVTQKLYLVERKDKKALLVHMLQDIARIPSALVFTRTKHGADKVAKFINASGIGAEAIHGNKSQNARQKALQNFKSNKTRVLVATDIAARGIDIKELSHVINFEIPNEPETYVHRIGRTGRAENSGIALSFCDREEVNYIHDIHKLINRQIPIENEHPFATDYIPPKRKKPTYQGPRNRGQAPRQKQRRRSWSKRR
ncbi:DEAD/DEAH box helicase [Candidatus Gracilibacteria bacterium]|nr:DEAD/DEAH box helicase [Candidatus Gracilibacteria bacterium]MCF7819307.1 DEAD/DEAH box helicase [Candidatus Gracilibacteria bacterium]